MKSQSDSLNGNNIPSTLENAGQPSYKKAINEFNCSISKNRKQLEEICLERKKARDNEANCLTKKDINKTENCEVERTFLNINTEFINNCGKRSVGKKNVYR